MDRETKIQLAKELLNHPGWNMIKEEINLMLSIRNHDIKVAMKSGNNNKSNYNCGASDMLEILTNLPERIIKENTTFLERIKKQVEQSNAFNRIMEGLRYGK